MLQGMLALLLCQLVGEAVVIGLGISVPGPVLGMVLMLLLLLLAKRVPAGLRQAAEGLLSHLALLFVPAGVGLVVHFELIAQEWLLLLVALVGSTLLTMMVTALVLKRFSRPGVGREGSK